MDILAALGTTILAAPGVKEALTGTAVKVALEFMKKTFLKLDSGTEVDKFRLPLQLVTMVCTTLATLATLAVNHQLGTFDMNTIVNFINVALPVLLVANGAGPLAQSAAKGAAAVKAAVVKR